MLIKICGVRDPDTAFFAATCGAHFIGMILTPGFRRSVSVLRAKQIAEAARQGGAEPVAVFVSETPSEVEIACHEMGIDVVQYYPKQAVLPAHLRRFYVNEQDAPLRSGHDHLLIESNKPGSGEKLDSKALHAFKGKDFFLAGGLTPDNIQEMILLYRPTGVDVSSGVEATSAKCPDLIAQFIQKVKSCESFV